MGKGLSIDIGNRISDLDSKIGGGMGGRSFAGSANRIGSGDMGNSSIMGNDFKKTFGVNGSGTANLGAGGLDTGSNI